jgi:HPr kinase/phosphorylase
MAAQRDAGTWRARAFGLEIEGSFPAPGLDPATGAGDAPRTVVELVPASAIDDGWPDGEATRLLEERLGGKAPARTIDMHERLGYRLYARHFGLAHIALDGSRVRCAPPQVAAWRWQRFLVGRVLPWAALLRGLEVFHASAVRVGGRAAAIMGPTGAGKTSLAVRLVLQGAGFMTDDVLALDRRDGIVRAHPGAAIVSLRPEEKMLLAPADVRRLGTVLGHSEKTYVAVPRDDEPLPLGVVYFLTPAERSPAQPIEPMPAPDPRLLLASTFVYSVRSPERLRNQLDVCAELAKSVPVYSAAVAPGRGAEELAGAIATHARSVVSEAA